MKWQTGRRSGNVVDRRGMRVGGPMVMGGGLLGVVVLLLSLFFGGGEGTEPSAGDPASGTGGSGYRGSPQEEQLREFVSVVLADTEDTWPALLRPMGVEYQEPRLVLFTGAVQSGCGFAQSAVGPFYCPADGQVYLDLSFFEELQRLGGEGDFAQAYVVAHEIGHHVQNLLGISERAQAAQQRAGGRAGNQISVRVELQADCFAGLWAHHAQRQRQILERGDVEEGLRAASAIGDDLLQRRSQGHVVPESFTHGSSQQRLEAFRRGLEGGSLEACDTFRR